MNNPTRTRIYELTINAKTQTDIDRLVSQGILKTLLQEFPGCASEIMYEWESRKLAVVRQMTTED